MIKVLGAKIFLPFGILRVETLVNCIQFAAFVYFERSMRLTITKAGKSMLCKQERCNKPKLVQHNQVHAIPKAMIFFAAVLHHLRPYTNTQGVI